MLVLLDEKKIDHFIRKTKDLNGRGSGYLFGKKGEEDLLKVGLGLFRLHEVSLLTLWRRKKGSS